MNVATWTKIDKLTSYADLGFILGEKTVRVASRVSGVESSAKDSTISAKLTRKLGGQWYKTLTWYPKGTWGTNETDEFVSIWARKRTFGE